MAYSDDQPRDDQGQWTSGGGSSGGLSTEDRKTRLEKAGAVQGKRPEVLQAYNKTHGTNLDAEHAKAIYAYTDDKFYSKINSQLVKGNQTPEMQGLTEAINDTISKAKPHEGTVYRGVGIGDKELAAKVLAKYEVGKETTATAFTSTSTDKETAHSFGDTIHFEIKSKTGMHIEGLSKVAGEEEVLFKTNTKFKVELKKLVGKTWQIRMSEA